MIYEKRALISAFFYWVTNKKVIQLIEYDADRAKVIYEI